VLGGCWEVAGKVIGSRGKWWSGAEMGESGVAGCGGNLGYHNKDIAVENSVNRVDKKYSFECRPGAWVMLGRVVEVMRSSGSGGEGRKRGRNGLWRDGGKSRERESKDVATLTGLRRAETVSSTHLTHLFWPSIGDDGFNVGNIKAKSIRDPRIKLSHRSITMTITSRKETTNRLLPATRGVVEEDEGNNEEGMKKGGTRELGALRTSTGTRVQEIGRSSRRDGWTNKTTNGGGSIPGWNNKTKGPIECMITPFASSSTCRPVITLSHTSRLIHTFKTTLWLSGTHASWLHANPVQIGKFLLEDGTVLTLARPQSPFYGPEFLRKPTVTDIEKLYRHHEEKHGFSGMLGCLDCTDWEWFGCPYAFKAQYIKRDHGLNPFILLEAAASQDLWIWHAFFGVAGSNNDINVLYQSSLFNDLKTERASEIPFVANGVTYPSGYYLRDISGIGATH
nr:hypothetical protein [Tanacetum cinerariifolium]